MAARRAAAGLLGAVLRQRQTLDDALIHSPAARAMADMAARDRALARAITSTTLRRKGQLDAVLNHFLDKPLPRRCGPLREILLAAACQLLFLNRPAHAAIDLAVRHAKQDRNARHFAKLANAVLRRVAEQGPELIAAQDAGPLNTPPWLWKRWVTTYGENIARAITQAHLEEAALDLTVKGNAEGWAERLGGVVLDTGSVRLASHGPVEKLEGYDEGQWWVQDAAAALPARLFGDVSGKRVADLCAAPGGKTAQLAHAGADVTAVDVSPKRLERLEENLTRLGLGVELVAADATQWMADARFDAVLLDAPCSGTGTLRRHPDIAYLKGLKDIEELSALQARLLRHAVSLLRPGGRLVYCSCSLEPEEGEQQIEALLEEKPDIRVDPIRSNEIYGTGSWLTRDGALRTLPYDLNAGDEKRAGIDGFFAARLRVHNGED
ncbi:MAG: RsmB/NOP family class I SAM-dependent RNA methyltransferase [Methyloligellaceae bacterium]